jgi:hypothetical protein
MIVQIDKASVTNICFLGLLLQWKQISATRKEEKVLDYSIRDFIVPPTSASFMIGLSMRCRLTWYQHRCIEFNSPVTYFLLSHIIILTYLAVC